MQKLNEKKIVRVGNGIKLTGLYAYAFELANDEVFETSNNQAARHMIQKFLDQFGYTEKAAQKRQERMESDEAASLGVAA